MRAKSCLTRKTRYKKEQEISLLLFSVHTPLSQRRRWVPVSAPRIIGYKGGCDTCHFCGLSHFQCTWSVSRTHKPGTAGLLTHGRTLHWQIRRRHRRASPPETENFVKRLCPDVPCAHGTHHSSDSTRNCRRRRISPSSCPGAYSE